MWDVLRHRTYRHLLAAQAIALLGTGLATVALGLLAYDLAAGQAGAVLGTALAIKMIAYVGVAPVAAALAQHLPRRAVLVGLDVVRAAVALALPFVTQVWQVYVLIFVLQSASAAFTPIFQATIPDVLPDEKDYTQALSLSRLAYDMESLLSPMLAAALLTVVGFHDLFAGTVVGFLASALLVASVVLPASPPQKRRGIYERITRGSRIYLGTPRLRGLLAVNAAVAAAGSMVFVNTVVMIQADLGLPQTAVAVALAAFGTGSMLAALAYSTAQTPSGRLLRRSAHPSDRPALFAAQFTWSHACWLLFYPLAGWAGAHWGMTVTFALLGAAAGLAVVVAWRVWPAQDTEVMEHEHGDGMRHTHPYWIDDQHPRWPRPTPTSKH